MSCSLYWYKTACWKSMITLILSVARLSVPDGFDYFTNCWSPVCRDALLMRKVRANGQTVWNKTCQTFQMDYCCRITHHISISELELESEVILITDSTYLDSWRLEEKNNIWLKESWFLVMVWGMFSTVDIKPTNQCFSPSEYCCYEPCLSLFPIYNLPINHLPVLEWHDNILWYKIISNIFHYNENVSSIQH